jgi:hypothetical protein
MYPLWGWWTADSQCLGALSRVGGIEKLYYLENQIF